MATYKLIQDIEAEDKILGPLTLRQFIFAMIAAFMFYMCVIMVIKHVIFLLVIFLPPALFFGFFALPFGRDQPTEIWFLAKLRFWFKPRRRIWNQSGVKELVTITVPKKIEHVYTNGLSPTEVQSRLQVLAQTIDSRGWATKHATADEYSQPMAIAGSSDRLIDVNSLPQEVPIDDPATDTDIMDAANPIARQFDTMIDQSSRERRQRLEEEMNKVVEAQAAPAAAPAPANWFTGETHPAEAAPMVIAPPVVLAATAAPEAVDDPAAEAALSAGLEARAESKQAFGNLRTMQPLSAQTAAPAIVPDDQTGVASDATAVGGTPLNGQDNPVTAPRDPAILSLATSNDLNLSTLAREAKKTRDKANRSPDEVVIPLH